MTRLQFLCTLIAAPFAALFGKTVVEASSAAPAAPLSADRMTVAQAKEIQAACLAEIRHRLDKRRAYQLTPEQIREFTALSEQALA